MSNPVLAVAGLRGGALATSLSANVAGLMARAGNKTLVVDAVVGGCLGLDLGHPLHPGEPVVRDVRPDLDLVAADDPRLLREIVDEARSRYDVVVVDGGAGFADRVVVPVRPDRASTGVLGSRASGGTPLLGVVLVGIPTRPRSILPRVRRAVADALPSDAPVFVSTVRSAVPVAWSARQSGLLVHELVARMDRAALDATTIDSVLGLARDYAELAEEVIVRLDDVRASG